MRLQVLQRLSTLNPRNKQANRCSTSKMISSDIYRYDVFTVPRTYIWRRAAPGTWTERQLTCQPDSGEGTHPAHPRPQAEIPPLKPMMLLSCCKSKTLNCERDHPKRFIKDVLDLLCKIH